MLLHPLRAVVRNVDMSDVPLYLTSLVLKAIITSWMSKPYLECVL
jgi:hypothetical protein